MNKHTTPLQTGFAAIFVALINVLILLATSKYGLALSADSANYLSVANNLFKGNGFIQFDGFMFYNTPPLYALILTPAYMLGVPALIYAKLINLLAFNISMYYLFRLQKHYIKPQLQGLALALAASSYWVFTQAYIYCLSESVFISLLITFLYYFLVQPARTKHKIICSMLLALLCMERYAAFMLLPGIFLFMLLNKAGFKNMVLLYAPTMLLSAAWFGRNYMLSGKYVGDHKLINKINPSALFENINKLYDANIYLLLILSISVISALVLFVLMIKRYSDPNTLIRQVASLLFMVCASYVLLLLMQAKLNINQLPRYLTIIWIPATLMFVVFIQIFLTQSNNRFIFAQILLASFISVQMTLIIKSTYKSYLNGAGGYHTLYWQDPNMTNFIINSLPAQKLMSNYPDYIWLTSGRDCSYTWFYGEDSKTSPDAKAGITYCLWFNDKAREQLMIPLDSIIDLYNLKEVCEKEKFSLWKVGEHER